MYYIVYCKSGCKLLFVLFFSLFSEAKGYRCGVYGVYRVEAFLQYCKQLDRDLMKLLSYIMEVVGTSVFGD